MVQSLSSGSSSRTGTPLVKGRRLTSFSNAEEDGYASEDVPFELETALVAEGAKYESTAVWQPKIVVDGRLMTGQNPASAGPLAEAIVEAFVGSAVSGPCARESIWLFRLL